MFRIQRELLRSSAQPARTRSARKAVEPFSVHGAQTVVPSARFAETPSLLALAPRIALAASHDMAVVITGETGTGKSYLARLIHDCSPRREQPFLVVSCGALAATLIESELFGHMRGAFTGADQGKPGKFAAAGTGTILLDEIDALGLDRQVKLLRVLEDGEYEPVGSNRTMMSHARVIAASNQDLEGAVAQGTFRSDLYYRLNVFALHLLPLRERTDDIAPLVHGMVARFSEALAKAPARLSTPALAALEGYAWPGNIRQLANVVRCAVLANTGPELLMKHLPESLF